MFNFLSAKKAKEELSVITKNIEEASAKLEALTEEINNKRNIATTIEKKIASLNNLSDGFIEMQELGVAYTPLNTEATEIERQINRTETEIASMIGAGEAVVFTRSYKIDGSEKKGRDFQKCYIDNLLIGFNAYVNSKEKSITRSNFSKNRTLIIKTYEKLNKRGNLLGVSINREYLELRLRLMLNILDLKIAKAEENEKIKQERRRLKEQEQLLIEAEKELKRLEEERKAMDIAFAKALTEEEREIIREELNQIDKRVADVDYRVKNPKAGWVYLITSPSLPNMYKCGVTRRLSGPMERVRELSTSSLPFAFELKAFCFSDNAFEIEAKMHEYFDSYRVAENREFFYGEVTTAIAVLRDKFNQDVHYGTYEEVGEE